MTKQYWKNYTVTLSELFFYIFFTALLFAKGIGLYDGQTWFKVFLLISLAGWALKQLFTEYTVKEMILIIALVGLGGAIYLNTHEKGALFCLLLVCGMKGIDLRRTFKVGLATWMLSFGGLFILTSFHILDSAFKVHDKLGLGRIIRWSLGYAHPNVLHISYLVLVCFAVYLLHDRFKIRWFLILEAVNLYVFMYSLSSTGFMAVSICLVLALYFSLRKRIGKAEGILIQCCLPFCLLLSLAAPVVLKEPLFSLVNKAVNNRLLLSQWFLQNQPAALLGVDTQKIVTSLRTMDNSYVFAYITYGIIFGILTVAAYFVLIYRKTRQQDGFALCLILSCLIAGVTEPFLFNTSFKNISLLFVGAMLFENKKAKKEASILGKYDRGLSIRLPDGQVLYNELKEAAGKKRKTLLTAAFILGTAVALIGFCCTKMPERYILPRQAFESTGDIEETYHLASPKDIPKEGDVVMGYIDETADMVPFTGNIAKVERFRNTAASGIVTVIITYMAGILYLWKKKTGRSKRSRRK